MQKLILLDAGHGFGPNGSVDDGAKGNQTTERAEIIAIAWVLLPILQQLPLEVLPIGLDERLSVAQKVKKINDECKKRNLKAADALLISLHLNGGAANAQGVEAWYGTKKKEGKVFGETLIKAVASGTKLRLRTPPAKPSHQDRLGRLAILDDTTPTSCLLELGFVSNKGDLAALQNRELFASAIYQGLRTYLNLPMDFFIDVPAGTWYFQAVRNLLKEGIVEIPPDGRFRPADTCTRAELAMVIARLLKSL